MRESAFQLRLIKKLQEMFPGCYIMKNDPAQIQGIPDLLILFRDKWAMLECKRANNATEQRNQNYYIRVFDEMSFAAFIHPGNEGEVLDDLQSAFGT